jgi:nucleotide-binding universal stress UspA family protein
MTTPSEDVSQSQETAEREATFRVLVPLDGSDLAAKALPVAEYLCLQLAGELHLVRAVPTLVVPYIPDGSYIPPEVYQQLADEQVGQAREYLDHVAADERARGVSVQSHIERGDAASVILDLASRLRPTLVLMTTHGRTGLARFALGSVADRVVRGGEAPVLLMRSFPELRQGLDLSHALVPLDASPLGETPLFSIALQLAGSVIRTMTLLRVADPRDGQRGISDAEAYLEEVRKRFIGQLEGRECTVSRLVRVSSSPAQSIVQCSQDGECDLVLMSTHGEAGIGRLAFGSITDRVLRDGRTPLLLVHPPRG